jgi:hypothetical protein
MLPGGNSEAERGRADMLRLGATISHPLACFAAQEAPARAYSSDGSWSGRLSLANVLMGFGTALLPHDRSVAATKFDEAATLYRGCTVDAESAEDAAYARDWFTVAQSEAAAAARPLDPERGVLFVFPERGR